MSVSEDGYLHDVVADYFSSFESFGVRSAPPNPRAYSQEDKQTLPSRSSVETK